MKANVNEMEANASSSKQMQATVATVIKIQANASNWKQT